MDCAFVEAQDERDTSGLLARGVCERVCGPADGVGGRHCIAVGIGLLLWYARKGGSLQSSRGGEGQVGWTLDVGGANTSGAWGEACGAGV